MADETNLCPRCSRENPLHAAFYNHCDPALIMPIPPDMPRSRHRLIIRMLVLAFGIVLLTGLLGCGGGRIPEAILTATAEMDVDEATAAAASSTDVASSNDVAASTPDDSPVAPAPINTALPTDTVSEASATPTVVSPSQATVPIGPENAALVEELMRIGRGAINDIAYSPDSRLLAVGTPLGVYLYNLTSMTEYSLIETQSGITSLEFSPDGHVLAAGSVDGPLYLWDTAGGKLIATLKGHTFPVNFLSTYSELAYSPDGRMIASIANHDDYVRVWDANDGSLITTLEGCIGEGVIAFSPDSQTLAYCSVDDSFGMWDTATGVLRASLSGATGNPVSAFSPDLQTLATGGGSDGTIRLWDVALGTVVETLEGEGEGVGTVSFSPDGEKLAAIIDGAVRLWRVSDGTLIGTWAGDGDTLFMRSIAFSPDDQTLAVGRTDGIVKLWNADDGAPLGTLHGSRRVVQKLVFAPDGQTLASNVGVWDLASTALLTSWDEHVDSVPVLAFSPDGLMLASGTSRGDIRLIDPKDGGLIALLEGKGIDGVEGLAFTPDGQKLIVGAENVYIWRVADRVLLDTFELYAAGLGAALALSPDGRTLASDSDIDVQLWDMEGTILVTLDTMSTFSIAFSPDGRTFATGEYHGGVQLWDAANGALLESMEEAAETVSSVAFSPNGQLLASGGDDHTIRIWNLIDGSFPMELEGHADGVQSVAFSPDGQTLVSGSWDGTVRLWDVASGSLLAVLEGHNSHIWTTVFSPDGRIVASGSRDGTIRLWGVPQN